jgi:hypothetical protein
MAFLTILMVPYRNTLCKVRSSYGQVKRRCLTVQDDATIPEGVNGGNA